MAGIVKSAGALAFRDYVTDGVPGSGKKKVSKADVRRVFALVEKFAQIKAVSITTTVQPSSPADGAIYILPSGRSGAQWGAFAIGALALYETGRGWSEVLPDDGWTAFVTDTQRRYEWKDSAWGWSDPLGASTIDTDATFAANSDAKVPSQKAVKTALDAKLAASAIDTDAALGANSNALVPSQAAVKAYIDGLLAANDAAVYKGAIDASANPNYPAASAGHTYRISVAGKIGGAAGPSVQVGDIALCHVDGSAAGDHATVGANWNIIQTNIDGAVVGPASATDGHIAQFDGATGKLLKGGLQLDSDTTLAANSNERVASQAAVKAYVDGGLAGKAPLASPALTGTPTAPTPAPGTNTTQLANTAFVTAAIDALIAAAPGALNTLDELAAALGDDANFAATVTAALAAKAPLASPALTGSPTAPTPGEHDNDTSIATSAYVMTAIKNAFGMTPEMFGAVGNGVADDTTALTNWLNAVMASSRRVGFLGYKSYRITGALPQINVPGVRIYGAGRSSSHDVGSAQGSIILCAGTAGYTALTVAPTSGAGNQRLDGIELIGFTVNANSVAAVGVALLSCFNWRAEVSVHEATSSGLLLGVVASLGEARDTQRGLLRFSGRQALNAAPALRLTGDTGANTSKNIFLEIDILHRDEIGIIEENADNNHWLDVRCSRASGGSAAYGWECRGGATEPQSVRHEIIYKYSGTVPLIARGTESYTVASQGIDIRYNDVSNGTPDPVEGTGAIIFGDHWRQSTPTPVAGVGALTAATSELRWRRRRKQVEFQIAITITTNGTGASYISVPMPATSANGTGFDAVFCGKEVQATGSILSARIAPNTSTLVIQTFNGGYPGADGYKLVTAGAYAAAA
ncbi:MAG TPA: DUF2793 domain-containing protein [Vitreimonas sp.]|uniref:DUF2793 domain-containing protein n=1 Tax=Vitreimonas sp. TaxID=3069702 RepID=UPI002D6C3B06|nr:DUF2793 domain-containing protein [Vitreimonas sp.]HYD87105.1 DUF2793 domain-containing protein [Vitreimonas sp.]